MKYKLAFSALLMVGMAFTALPVHAQTAATLSASDKTEIATLFSSIEKVVLGQGGSFYSLVSPSADANLSQKLFDASLYDNAKNVFTIGTPSVVTPYVVDAQGDGTVAYTVPVTVHNELRYFDGQSAVNFTLQKDHANGKWYLLDTNLYNYTGESSASLPRDMVPTDTTADGTAQRPRALPDYRSSHAGSFTFFALFGGMLLLPILFLILVVLCGAFWIWMLVEACVRKEYPHKALWIILLVVFQLFAAIVYYFVEHRPYKKSQKAAAVSQVPVSPAEPATPL